MIETNAFNGSVLNVTLVLAVPEYDSKSPDFYALFERSFKRRLLEMCPPRFLVFALRRT